MAEEKEHIINIRGTSVEVSEEVYLTYFRMDRQARGVDEKDIYNNTASYDALDTNETTGRESIADAGAIPVEDIAIAHIMEEKLHSCLALLSKPERVYIYQRNWEGLSQTELADSYGVSQQALSYREQRILAKLKKLLEK